MEGNKAENEYFKRRGVIIYMQKICKKIHYCWFGRGEKPELALKCIQSWKEKCKDYEIIEWNEDNFDINSNKYVKQAYEVKKYAFVTDYVRLYVLYNYGGIYMDTDVEVIKPLDEFLDNPAFSGFENNNKIPTGIMAAQKGNEWIKDLLDEYDTIEFIKKDGTYDLTTNCERITKKTIEKYNLKSISSYQNLNNVVILYPYDYFCPKDWETGKINLTDNTYTIHHFAGSWHTDEEKKGAEKRREKLKKYIEKYGEDSGKVRLNKKELIDFYIRHPFKCIVRITEKSKEKIAKGEKNDRK